MSWIDISIFCGIRNTLNYKSIANHSAHRAEKVRFNNTGQIKTRHSHKFSKTRLCLTPIIVRTKDFNYI